MKDELKKAMIAKIPKLEESLSDVEPTLPMNKNDSVVLIPGDDKQIVESEPAMTAGGGNIQK